MRYYRDYPARNFIRDVAVSYQGDDCLIWPFVRRGNNGYPILYEHGKKRGAHRFVCIGAHGEPPTPRHEAAHLCGKGHLGCVNPRHLAWKTPKENQADKIIHGVHNRGERNGNAVLTAEKVQEIRSLKTTMPRRELAKIYGVTPQTISKVTTGTGWSHIP